MKKWLCYNLLGEKPEHVDIFQSMAGLGLISFFIFWASYLFIYLPFFFFV